MVEGASEQKRFNRSTRRGEKMAEEKQEMVRLWDSVPGFDFNTDFRV
jgi:hypothetical protein